MKVVHSFFSKFLPVCFIVVILSPLLNNTLNIFNFERVDENRRFSDTLSLDFKRLDKFPKQAEKYINDNFEFRAPLISVYQHVKFNYFKISPFPEKTLLGKDEWFFKGGEEIEILQGFRTFSDSQLTVLAKKWEYRKRYFDSLQIKVYWIPAPFKHTVYADKLPFNIVVTEKRQIENVRSNFSSELQQVIIDPFDTLVAERVNHPTYLKLDNHWSDYAGYLTTNLFVNRIKIDFPNRKFFSPQIKWIDTVSSVGIHKMVLGIEGLSEQVVAPVFQNSAAKAEKKYGFKSPLGFPYPWIYEQRFTNIQASSKLRILVIRDSFGKMIIPFLNEYFSESVYIFDAWKYGLNKDIVEKIKPDIVLYLGLETHMDKMLE